MLLPSTEIRPFGFTDTGDPVQRITLNNREGTCVDLLNYGATLHRIRTPNASGQCEDIVLYCESPADYQRQTAYLGGTIGRYANRIANSHFSLNGKSFALNCNEPPNHLHGGQAGFHRRIWSASTYTAASLCGVKFKLHSPSLDQGYPGALDVIVDYSLSTGNRLKINFSATSDDSTIISMTNHAYFNLSGTLFTDLSDHWVQIFSDQITPTFNGLPNGDIEIVTGTALDLSGALPVMETLNNLPGELNNTQGFDHNYVFSNSKKLCRMARVLHRPSGRVLSVYSDHPAMQFYTANFLGDCSVRGPGGRLYKQFGALCLEPQHYPDAPNSPQFPSPVIHPGETYKHCIEYHFDTNNRESKHAKGRIRNYE